MRKLVLLPVAVLLVGAPVLARAGDFTLASPAFADHATIPQRYTCNGAGISPPLVWSGAPRGTRAYALIVTDPDAPDPAHPTHTFVHWVAFNLPAATTALTSGAALPRGTRPGLNGTGHTGYTPPCPPIGQHRYFFRLFALDAPLEIGAHPDRAALLKAMHGHVLARAVLIGTYAHH
ncbi:MAG: YbhB/YbcL family Raf kinase inhibitor-like protein [Gammaproteobacteria bacterium]